MSKAGVVVAAGRGFAEEVRPQLTRELWPQAGRRGLACSRPLAEGVELDSATRLYIGVSGIMLSPKAYVACGISGQMQHMVG